MTTWTRNLLGICAAILASALLAIAATAWHGAMCDVELVPLSRPLVGSSRIGARLRGLLGKDT